MNDSDNPISSSVLKPSKLRAPLKDLNLIPSNEEENTTFLANRKRRVSFANVNKIKEFNAGAESLLVCHTPAYEEPFSNSSDSSYPSNIGDSPNIKLTTNSTVNGTYMMIRDENVNPDSVMKEIIQENVKITTTEFDTIRYPLNAINLTKPLKSLEVHGNNVVNKHCNVNAIKKRKSGNFFQSEMEFSEDVENIRPSASLVSSSTRLSSNRIHLSETVKNQSVGTTNMEFTEVISNIVCPSNFVKNSTRLSANDMELTEAIDINTLKSYDSVPNLTRCSMNNMELTEAIANHEFNSSDCVPNSTKFSVNNMELTEAIGSHTLRSSQDIPNSTRCSMNNMDFTEVFENHKFNSSDYVPNSTRYSTNNMELTEANQNHKFISSHCIPNSTRFSANNMELTEVISKSYRMPDSPQAALNITESSTNNMEFTEAIGKSNSESPTIAHIGTRYFANNMELKMCYQMPDSPQSALNTTELSTNNMEFTEAIGKSNSKSPIITNIGTRFSANNMESTMCYRMPDSPRAALNTTELSMNNMEFTEAIGKSKSPVITDIGSRFSANNMESTMCYRMPDSPQAALNTTELSMNNMEFTEAIGKSKSPVITDIGSRFSTNNMELTEANSMCYQVPNSPQTNLNKTELSMNNMEFTEAIGKSNSNSPNIVPNTSSFSMNNMELVKVSSQVDSSFVEAVLHSKEQSINNMELGEAKTFFTSTCGIPNVTKFCTNSMNFTKIVPNQLSELNEVNISTNRFEDHDLSTSPNILNSTKSSVKNIDVTEAFQNPCLNTHENAANKTKISLNIMELSEHVEPQINKTQIGDYNSDFKSNGGSSSNGEVKIQVNDQVMDSNHSLSFVNTLEPNNTKLKSNDLSHFKDDMSVTELPNYIQNHEGGSFSCAQLEDLSVGCSSVCINNMEFTENLSTNILCKEYVTTTLKDKTNVIENSSVIETRSNDDTGNCEVVNEVSFITDEMNVTEAVTCNIYKEYDLNVVKDRDIHIPCELVCNETDFEIKDAEALSNAYKTPFKEDKILSNKVFSVKKSFVDQDFSLHFDESTVLPETEIKDDKLLLSCSENAHNLKQGRLSREAMSVEDEFGTVSCKENSITNNETLNTITAEIKINDSIPANELLSNPKEILLPISISLKEKINDNELHSELENRVPSGEEASKQNKNFEVSNKLSSKCEYNNAEPNIAALIGSNNFEDHQNENENHNISLFNNITLRKNRNMINENTDTINDSILQKEKFNFSNFLVVSNTCELSLETNVIAENDKIIEDADFVGKLKDKENTMKEFQLKSNNSNLICDFRPKEFAAAETNTSICKSNPQDADIVGKLKDKENTMKEFQLKSNNSNLICDFRPKEFAAAETNTSICKSNPQDTTTYVQGTPEKSTNEKLEIYPGDTYNNLLFSLKDMNDSENDSVGKIGNENVSTYSMESLCLLDSAVFAETPDRLTFDLKKIGRKSIGKSGKENSSGIAQKRKLSQIEQEEAKDEIVKRNLEISSKIFCSRNNCKPKSMESKAIFFGAIESEEAMEENSVDDIEAGAFDISRSSTSECEKQEGVEVMNDDLVTNKNQTFNNNKFPNKNNCLALDEHMLNHVETLGGRKRLNSLSSSTANSSGKHEERQFRINIREKYIPSFENKKMLLHTEEKAVVNNQYNRRTMFTQSSNEKLSSVARQSLPVTTKRDKNKHELKYRKSIAVRLHAIDDEIRKKWCLKEVSHGVWSIELLPKLLCMLMYVDETVDSFTKFTFEENESGCKTPWTRFAVNNIKKVLSLQMLTFSCYSESRIIDLLNQVEPYVLQTIQFAKELRFLCNFYCAEITGNILSLDLMTMESRCWIKLNIDITSIDIKANDISVRSIIGEVKQYKIENLYKGMAPRENMLTDFIEKVKINLVNLNCIQCNP